MADEVKRLAALSTDDFLLTLDADDAAPLPAEVKAAVERIKTFTDLDKPLHYWNNLQELLNDLCIVLTALEQANAKYEKEKLLRQEYQDRCLRYEPGFL